MNPPRDMRFWILHSLIKTEIWDRSNDQHCSIMKYSSPRQWEHDQHSTPKNMVHTMWKILEFDSLTPIHTRCDQAPGCLLRRRGFRPTLSSSKACSISVSLWSTLALSERRRGSLSVFLIMFKLFLMFSLFLKTGSAFISCCSSAFRFFCSFYLSSSLVIVIAHTWIWRTHRTCRCGLWCGIRWWWAGSILMFVIHMMSICCLLVNFLSSWSLIFQSLIFLLTIDWVAT